MKLCLETMIGFSISICKSVSYIMGIRELDDLLGLGWISCRLFALKRLLARFVS